MNMGWIDTTKDEALREKRKRMATLRYKLFLNLDREYPLMTTWVEEYNTLVHELHPKPVPSLTQKDETAI